jgi:hypothetical protein
MASELPPPRPADPPMTGLRHPKPFGRRWSWAPWLLAIVAVLLVGGAVVIFSAGDDLFGSDPDTIDSYHREVLDSCELPPDSELVQTSTRRVTDGQRSYRSMWYVYASPLPAPEVAEFFGVTAQRSMLVSQQRTCRFSQRPSVLVLPVSVAGEAPTRGAQSGDSPVDGDDGLWADPAAEVTMNAGVPAGTQSLYRLRLAQPEVEGMF